MVPLKTRRKGKKIILPIHPVLDLLLKERQRGADDHCVFQDLATEYLRDPSIGHSQGGLLTKLTATQTGEALVRAATGKTLTELKLSPEEDQLVRSGHSCQDKSVTIEEVRRILLEPLRQISGSAGLSVQLVKESRICYRTLAGVWPVRGRNRQKHLIRGTSSRRVRGSSGPPVDRRYRGDECPIRG